MNNPERDCADQRSVSQLNACAGFFFIFVWVDLILGGGQINISGLRLRGPHKCGGCFGSLFVCECALTFAL